MTFIKHFHQIFRNTLSVEKSGLDYRHALAHRIPLYVAPYTLNPVKLDEHNELERRKDEAHRQRKYDL